jgi:hypothetical protein
MAISTRSGGAPVSWWRDVTAASNPALVVGTRKGGARAIGPLHGEGMGELAGIHPDDRGHARRVQPLLFVTHHRPLPRQRYHHISSVSACLPEEAPTDGR